VTVTHHAPPPVGSLVRVTITAGDRRLDVGAPGSVPVAELVPEFARELGQLDPETVWGGYRLVRADGSTVDVDRGLQAQGIDDGSVLALESGADAVAPKVYDDVVEAVADVVEEQFAPWTARNAAQTAIGTAVALLLTAALVLVLMQDRGMLTVALAGAVAVLLLGAAAVVSRARADHASALAVTLTATVFGGVAGLVAGDGAVVGLPAALAGAGLVVTAGIGVVVLGDDRGPLAAPLGLGATLVVAGLLVGVVDLSAARVYPITLAVVVAAAVALPWLATSSSRLRVVSPRSDLEVFADQPPIDASGIGVRTRQGQELLVGLAVATGLVVIAMTPVLVATGVVGTVLAVVAVGLTILRSRLTRTRAAVVATMVTAVVALVEVGVLAALLHPDWRPVLVVVLAVVAAAVLTVVSIAPKPRVRLGRLADAAELTGTIALLPLAVVTAGIIGLIRS
jgi:type VII secretion integral membrane protein EccD